MKDNIGKLIDFISRQFLKDYKVKITPMVDSRLVEVNLGYVIGEPMPIVETYREYTIRFQIPVNVREEWRKIDG